MWALPYLLDYGDTASRHVDEPLVEQRILSGRFDMMHPMPTALCDARPRSRTPALTEKHTWVDLVVDLSLDRKAELPDVLPQARPDHQYRHDSITISAHLCPRETRGADVVIVVEDRRAKARVPRTGFVYYQTSQEHLHYKALGSALGDAAPPWDEESLSRHNLARYQRIAVRKLVGLAATFWEAHRARLSNRWTVKTARTWTALFSTGLTHPSDMVRLSEVMAFTRDDLFAIERLLKEDVSVEQMVYWWPHTERIRSLYHFTAIKTLAAKGITLEDLAPYRGTVMDPLDPTPSSGAYDEETVLLNIYSIADVAASGWTPQGRLLVESSAPAGCDPVVWQELWESFMPAQRADAYLRAGYSFQEAVGFHLRGKGPDDEALAVMGALNA